MSPTLLVPGYQNSGPGHWQSLWEGTLRGGRRVEMPNWDFPHRADWVEALDDAIAACGGEPPLLVGHSLGCLAIAHWAAGSPREIRGALLAVPPDVERADTLDVLRGFGPIPRGTLPFPALVAASSDDPFMTLDRARGLAADWGARFVDLGPCGHLNQASGHGEWPLGEALLQELM
jgi:predicted alpha/beta hydrolase family esterase